MNTQPHRLKYRFWPVLDRLNLSNIIYFNINIVGKGHVLPTQGMLLQKDCLLKKCSPTVANNSHFSFRGAAQNSGSGTLASEWPT